MSWKNILKKDKPNWKQLDEMFGGDSEAAFKQGNCVVSVCNATNCMHNENKKCKLDSITISSPDYGPQCDMFNLPKKKTEHSRGQQSFIDRATRNLREQERNE